MLFNIFTPTHTQNTPLLNIHHTFYTVPGNGSECGVIPICALQLDIDPSAVTADHIRSTRRDFANLLQRCLLSEPTSHREAAFQLSVRQHLFNLYLSFPHLYLDKLVQNPEQYRLFTLGVQEVLLLKEPASRDPVHNTDEVHNIQHPLIIFFLPAE